MKLHAMLQRPLAALMLAAVVAAPAASAALPSSVDGQPLPSLAPMLERATPAVVNISTRGKVMVRDNPLMRDPFFRRFFDLPEQGPRQRQTQSLGSGVIVDADKGYVLTNAHVIDKADEITVTLANGHELPATLIGSDPETDVAVIQVEAEGLTALPLGDSRELKVGDFVVAIGNPFGLGQTATSGIVSALGRSGLGIEGYEDFIQTDASINPGNSGGALINLRGELIGINTAILAPSGGNIGIGFAIPTHMARHIMEQLVEHGGVQRGVLGVSVQDLTPALAEAFGIKQREGVVVAQVLPDSAAEKAGLKSGDIIIELNGQPMRQAAEIRNRIGLLRAGDQVELVVLRDGKRKNVKATIQNAAPGENAGQLMPKLAGAEFGEVQRSFDGGQRTAVTVTAVAAGSAAQAAGLRAGDVILSVNRQPVASLAEFTKRVRDNKGRLLLHIQRGNGAFFLLLQ